MHNPRHIPLSKPQPSPKNAANSSFHPLTYMSRVDRSKSGSKSTSRSPTARQPQNMTVRDKSNKENYCDNIEGKQNNYFKR